MKFIDAYILASTKRKTRRIRTALVIIVSSLLFAVLFGGAFMAKGVLNAGAQVKDVGFNGRNLVSVSPTGNGFYDFAAVTAAIEREMNDELKARKVKVTETTKQDASYQLEFMRRLNKVTSERQAESNKKVEQWMREQSKPTAVYHFVPSAISQLIRPQATPEADLLVDELKKQEEAGVSPDKMSLGPPINDQLEFYAVEQAMLRTQLQPGQSFEWAPGDPYPLIISYSYLEKLANRSFARVDAAERNAGYRALMNQYAGHELTYCYRNQTAQTQLKDVIHYNKIAETDKDAATKPLAIPVCGAFDQTLLKKLEIIGQTNADEPKPLFPKPKEPVPVTTQIRFKIVGYVPTIQQTGATDIVTQALTGISSLPTGTSAGIIPAEVVAQDSLLSPVENEDFYAFPFLFADFKTRDEQKAFLEQGCKGNECQSGVKPFIAAFGNLSLALEGIFRSISKILLVVMAVVMVIAALMMTFTISKVIADSTKEIAVFRSLGARRRDIAQIYYTYGVMLAASALVLAVVLALIGAAVVSSLYQDRIAQGLVQATGAYNTDVQVNLVGMNGPWMLGIIAALAVAAFVGTTIPILISLRRKLITILREE
ncbi:MAG TPA: ABC transporter permease [Candidatus Saccharimonadales bacterium]|nr:ABC transporter permease [Candidatus Saccharimonadales bacterium]